MSESSRVCSVYMTLPFQNRLHGHCFFGFPFFVVVNVPLFVVSFFEGDSFFCQKKSWEILFARWCWESQVTWFNPRSLEVTKSVTISQKGHMFTTFSLTLHQKCHKLRIARCVPHMNWNKPNEPPMFFGYRVSIHHQRIGSKKAPQLEGGWYVIYIPRTVMTSICEGQPPKIRSFPTKTRVIWVQGIYIYMYIYTVYTYTSIF